MMARVVILAGVVAVLAVGAAGIPEEITAFGIPLPAGHTALNVSVFADDGPRVAWAAWPPATRLNQARLSLSGESADPKAIDDVMGPSAGERGKAFDVACYEGRTVVAFQKMWATPPELSVAYLEGERMIDRVLVRVPGFGRRSEYTGGVQDPRTCVLGSDLWLCCHNPNWESYVGVTACPVGRWTEWRTYRPIVQGWFPSICGDEERGLFVFCTKTRWYLNPGPVMMARSPDGETWEEPRGTVDDDKAIAGAGALDPEAGLLLVYSAFRVPYNMDEGTPLFVARSADFGETWGPPVMITAPDSRTMRPDALCFEGRLYIAYLERPEDPDAVEYPGAGVTAWTCALDPKTIPVPEP